MSVRTDTVNLNVNVNGNKAQNELNNLRKRASDLKLEMEGLSKRTQEYRDKKKQLAEVEGSMVKLKQEIGLTALSQKELVSELNKLKAMKGSVVPFSDEFKKLDRDIKTVESRLYEVRNGVQGFSASMSRVKDEVKQFGMLAAGYLGFQFLSSQVTNLISGSGRLSDQLADMRRVSGLTAQEVAGLNSEFSKMNTRTSTEGLRQIAIIAGKLGVAKNDILGFVEATDKLVVALGDELGDADQITTNLGKILNVFDGTINGDNISRLGNTIVDLANKGVASGPFLVDFAQRVSGIAKTAGISLPAVLGLAAGLEETGAKVESSATAIQKVISDIASDLPKAARVAGMSVQDFNAQFAKNPQEALLSYAKGLVQNKQSFAEVNASFKDAGEEGVRIVSVLSTLGQKTDFFRQKMQDAGVAMKNTDEIQEAFALKNETFGATLDKVGKDLNKMFASSSMTKAIQSLVYGFRDLLKALMGLPEWVSENRTAITALIGVYVTYLAYTNRTTQAKIIERITSLASAAVDRLSAAAKAVAAAATAAYGFAVDLLTGKVKIATVMQRIYNTAVAANPIAAVVAVLAIAATAYVAFTNRVKEATAAQRLNKEIANKVADDTTATLTKMKMLTEVVKDNSGSLENRKKALAELISISPEYLKGLTLENINTAEGTRMLKNYNDALVKSATLKAKNALLDEKAKNQAQQRIDLEADPSLEGVNVSGILDQISSGKIKEAFDALGKQISGSNGQVKQEIWSKFAEFTKVSEEERKLAMDLTNEAKKNVASVTTDTGTIATTAASNTVEALRAQVKALDEAFEKIDVHNTKALKDNRATRKKLQDQLDSLEGKESKGNGEYKRLQREAAEFYKSLEHLRDKNNTLELSDQEREAQQAILKYQQLLEKSKDFYVKHITTKKQFSDQETLIEQSKQAELEAIFQKYFKKRLTEAAEAEYNQSLQLSQEHFENQRAQAARDFSENKLTQEEYQAELRHIENSEIANRVIIAHDYSATVKKAAADVVTFTKEQEKKKTDNLVEETTKRKEFLDKEKLSGAQLGVIQAKGKGVNAEADAKKKLLKVQFDLDTQYMDKKSEMFKLKEAELQQNLKDIDDSTWKKKVENILRYGDFFTQAMDSLNTFIANRENRLLADDKKKADGKKTNLKRQLDSRLISQAQYDKKVQALDEETDRRERALKRKQAEREKAGNLFKAIIATARAVAEALPNIPLSIIAGVMGGLQIAAIANAPLPELATGDWFRTGDKHSDPSRGIPILIERDEAVMSAAAMTDSKPYTVTGTVAQITSALNSMNGGANWAGGAHVDTPRWRSAPAASINPSLPQMAFGGAALQAQTSASASNDPEVKELLRQQVAELQANREQFRTMQTRFRAVLSIKELRDEQALYDAARNAGGFKQE